MKRGQHRLEGAKDALWPLVILSHMKQMLEPIRFRHVARDNPLSKLVASRPPHGLSLQSTFFSSGFEAPHVSQKLLFEIILSQVLAFALDNIKTLWYCRETENTSEVLAETFTCRWKKEV